MSASSYRSKLGIVGIVVGLVAAACTSVGAAEPNDAGEVVVRIVDNRFEPSTIRVKVGQRVRFVIENQGRHTHEFMVGREPVPGSDYLEDDVWTPFEQDFWEGIEVDISGTGMPMGFPGVEMEMDMGDGQMQDGQMQDGQMQDGQMQDGQMQDGQMQDGQMQDGQMQDGQMAGEGDHAEGDGGMDMGGGEEGHHGGMVMLQPGDPSGAEPGQVSIIEFTVPADKVGVWGIGCFQEAGQHYEDGMRGTLIVEEA